MGKFVNLICSVLGTLLLSFLPVKGQPPVPPALPVMDAKNYRSSLNENPSNRLIALDSIVPGLRKDIRYAGTDNFTRKQIYGSPGAFARMEVAEALKVAADTLKYLGLGLVLFDAYRPYSATKIFWELIGDERYVASPVKGSRHNRGAAVDVTLYRLSDGQLLEMPTDYDDFSDKAHSRATSISEDAANHRDLLQSVMKYAGFELFETEWWHFDFRGWERYPLLDMSFEEL